MLYNLQIISANIAEIRHQSSGMGFVRRTKRLILQNQFAMYAKYDWSIFEN